MKKTIILKLPSSPFVQKRVAEVLDKLGIKFVVFNDLEQINNDNYVKNEVVTIGISEEDATFFELANVEKMIWDYILNWPECKEKDDLWS